MVASEERQRTMTLRMLYLMGSAIGVLESSAYFPPPMNARLITRPMLRISFRCLKESCRMLT